jgi:CPA2 family monovalent cation:H+ antiporter-2
MPHHTPLIALLAVGLVLAFILGSLAHRLRLSPIVGYLLAGILVGPFTPGFVADPELAMELSEIGVILLMFGVGLHFSVEDLLEVKTIAIPGAIAQIALATGLGWGLAWFMGWPTLAGLVFGLALSVASTVVLLRAMEDRRLLETRRGKIAVGWLIVEDLVMVVALVLLPALAESMDTTGDGAPGAGSIAGSLGLTLLKVGAFVALMMVVGRRAIPWVLERVAGFGSRELFTLSVLAIALGVAFGSAKLFGVSFALGAFFAGMLLNGDLSHKAASDSLPLRDAFAVLFFVSVGMLFNPMTLIESPLPILGALLIVVVGKSIAALAIMAAFKQPRESSALIAASLAQIGEFSFILASLGVALNLLPVEGQTLILGAAMLSIVLNPFVFMLADKWAPRPPPEPDAEIVAPSQHAIIIGFGRVGSRIARALGRARVEYSVVEDRSEVVERLHEQGVPAITGNAVTIEVLKAAAVDRAQLIYVTVPDGFEAARIVELARQLNPSIRIFARSHNDAEIEQLTARGADVVISGEEEIAQAMIDASRLPRPTPPPEPPANGAAHAV